MDDEQIKNKVSVSANASLSSNSGFLFLIVP